MYILACFRSAELNTYTAFTVTFLFEPWKDITLKNVLNNPKSYGVFELGGRLVIPFCTIDAKRYIVFLSWKLVTEDGIHLLDKDNTQRIMKKLWEEWKKLWKHEPLSIHFAPYTANWSNKHVSGEELEELIQTFGSMISKLDINPLPFAAESGCELLAVGSGLKEIVNDQTLSKTFQLEKVNRCWITYGTTVYHANHHTFWNGAWLRKRYPEGRDTKFYSIFGIAVLQNCKRKEIGMPEWNVGQEGEQRPSNRISVHYNELDHHYRSIKSKLPASWTPRSELIMLNVQDTVHDRYSARVKRLLEQVDGGMDGKLMMDATEGICTSQSGARHEVTYYYESGFSTEQLVSDAVDLEINSKSAVQYWGSEGCPFYVVPSALFGRYVSKLVHEIVERTSIRWDTWKQEPDLVGILVQEEVYIYELLLRWLFKGDHSDFNPNCPWHRRLLQNSARNNIPSFDMDPERIGIEHSAGVVSLLGRVIKDPHIERWMRFCIEEQFKFHGDHARGNMHIPSFARRLVANYEEVTIMKIFSIRNMKTALERIEDDYPKRATLEEFTDYCNSKGVLKRWFHLARQMQSQVLIIEGSMQDMINAILDSAWVMRPLVYSFWSIVDERKRTTFAEELAESISERGTTAFFTCMGGVTTLYSRPPSNTGMNQFRRHLQTSADRKYNLLLQEVITEVAGEYNVPLAVAKNFWQTELGVKLHKVTCSWVEENPHKGTAGSVIKWMEKLVFLELPMKQDKDSNKAQLVVWKKKVKRLLSGARITNKNIIDAYADFIVPGKVVLKQAGRERHEYKWKGMSSLITAEAAKKQGESFVAGRRLISKDLGGKLQEIAKEEVERARKRLRTETPSASEAEDEADDYAAM